MPSIPEPLGSESPIVAEISYTAGSGPLTLSGALGNFFRFDEFFPTDNARARLRAHAGKVDAGASGDNCEIICGT